MKAFMRENDGKNDKERIGNIMSLPQRALLFIFISVFTPSESIAQSQNSEHSRQIDRPYTLGQHQAAWRILGGYANHQDFSSSKQSDRTSTSFFYPIFWEQGITDAWTLIWSPFPFDFRHQLYRDERQVIGLEFLLFGNAYGDYEHFLWRPALRLSQKLKLAENFAIQTQVLSQMEIGMGRDQIPTTLGVDLGGLMQLTGDFALTPRLSIYHERFGPEDIYLGHPPQNRDEALFRFPLGFDLSWMLSQRHEIQLEYNWFSLGYSRHFRSHQVFLSLMTYWDNQR
jgi:hypothetical protein